MEGEEGASLHVVDARTVSNIAFDFERQAFDKAHGMHGVEVRQHENGAVGRAPARARDEVVCKTGAAGDAFEPGAGPPVGALDVIHHAVNGLGNGGRTLDLDPAAKLGEHAIRIELRFTHSVALPSPSPPPFPLPLPPSSAHAAVAISLIAARRAATTRFWPRVNCVRAKPLSSFGMVRMSFATLSVGNGGIGTAGSWRKR